MQRVDVNLVTQRGAAAADIEKSRKAITQKLAEAQEILAGHRAAQAKECASGRGKRCDGVSYTVETWQAAGWNEVAGWIAEDIAAGHVLALAQIGEDLIEIRG